MLYEFILSAADASDGHLSLTIFHNLIKIYVCWYCCCALLLRTVSYSYIDFALDSLKECKIISHVSCSVRGDRERAALGDSLTGIVVLDVELVKVYPPSPATNK